MFTSEKDTKPMIHAIKTEQTRATAKNELSHARKAQTDATSASQAQRLKDAEAKLKVVEAKLRNAEAKTAGTVVKVQPATASTAGTDAVADDPVCLGTLNPPPWNRARAFELTTLPASAANVTTSWENVEIVHATGIAGSLHR